MKQMKRFSAILLSMAMVFSLTLNVFAIHDHDHCGETLNGACGLL